MYTSALDTDEHAALWQRLVEHPFECPEQGLDFTRRLAREQGWRISEARAAVEEYRRFCFLAIVEPASMTPSAAVDEVWHLHLLHTQDYWLQFCPQVLGRPLHHGPTRGGRDEARRYRAQYADTLAAYERHFGLPPVRWWPGHAARFADPSRIRRVDRHRHWVLPKPRLSWRALSGLCLLLPGTARALPVNVLDWTADPFLLLYASLMLAGIAALFIGRRRMRARVAAHGGELSVWETACLAAGPERAVDAAIADLLQRRAIVLEPDGQRLRLTAEPATLPEPLSVVARRVGLRGNIDAVIKDSLPWLDGPLRALVTRGLLLAPADAAKAALQPVLPLALVLLLGLAKIAVGLSRDKPIGILAFLCAVTGAIVLITAFKRPQRTRAGDALLRELNERYARIARAPRDSELALAVALVGTAALAGSAFDAYHQARQGSGSGDGGSSGDGDGGSGCGGCGGD
jgi:uncharacterized protein (TIGR04222 family)